MYEIIIQLDGVLLRIEYASSMRMHTQMDAWTRLTQNRNVETTIKQNEILNAMS